LSALVRELSRAARWTSLLATLHGAAEAQVPASSWVVGGAGASWSGSVDRWIALDESVRPGSVQPREIPPGHSLVRELVRTGGTSSQRNFFGYRWAWNKGPLQLEADTLEVNWHPRMWRSGGVDAGIVSIMRGLVDGDELTSAFTHKARADGRPNGSIFFTLDLGIPVPVDSVVFFPPQSGLTDDNQRQRELFPRGYEVTRTTTPVDWLIFEDENTSAGSVGYHPLEEVLGSTFANNQSVVSLTPELRFTRFLRFKFGEVIPTTLLAETEVFGRGFPAEARYISEPHSFGEPVSLGRITWKFTRFRQTRSGEVFEDPVAPVELVLRTRAGTDPEPKSYFVFDELGRFLEVPKAQYFDSPRIVEQFSKGIAGFRAKRGDDIENWNNWSVAYRESGDEIRSSDGREFLQFRFEILSEDPLAFGVLDSIAFEFSPLLADSVLAEISLAEVVAPRVGAVEVPLGVDTLFVYDLRTISGAGGRAGFDGFELDLPSGARFLSLEIGGVEATEGTDFSMVSGDGRLRFTFPEPFTQDTAFRVRFRSAVFQSSVFLEGRIFNSDPAVASLPQSIEAGNARADVGSNSIQVVAGEAKLTILGPLELSSPVITPNGDGANEQTVIGFDLFGVDGVDLKVEVYDLAGRRVKALLDTRSGAGPYGPSWGGDSESGDLVPPGLYLIRVEVEVDQGAFTRVEPVAVVY